MDKMPKIGDRVCGERDDLGPYVGEVVHLYHAMKEYPCRIVVALDCEPGREETVVLALLHEIEPAIPLGSEEADET